MSVDLSGKVAVVTGASRGVGKGIALELGAAGATVYVTGRTKESGGGPVVLGSTLPGTVGDTAKEVTALGGNGLAVALDHKDDAAVEALFKRVREEQGRLDILVNNAFFVPDALLSGQPYWEMPLSLWDDMTDVGVRSSYVASVYGAQIMVPQRSGLIVNTSSPGGGHYTMTPAYGIGKVAVDRMAFDMAQELRGHNVATVSIWLGLISTERTEVAARTFEQFDISSAETPRFVGKGVAALAADPDIMSLTGRVLYSAELPDRYAFTEDGGERPPTLRSVWGDPPEFRAF
jgi:NAD(P)-dependent dehydrogenase (short-subunit alcohol dehydrogenase family)